MEQLYQSAKRVIEKCGGHQAVADMTGVHLTRVHRWTYPADRGGTGGLIPAKHQPTLMEEARKRGIDLQPSDFFDAPEDQAA